jgi:hypothetical protein
VHQLSWPVKLVVILTLGLMQLACPRHEPPMRSVGPEVKASLVVYFKSGVTNERVNAFWEEVLSRPDPSGKGYYHRNGVGDIGRVAPVQGHEGISMSFFPDATKEEREEVIHDITSSPIVYKVLRDIAPADVKKLD